MCIANYGVWGLYIRKCSYDSGLFAPCLVTWTPTRELEFMHSAQAT